MSTEYLQMTMSLDKLESSNLQSEGTEKQDSVDAMLRNTISFKKQKFIKELEIGD